MVKQQTRVKSERKTAMGSKKVGKKQRERERERGIERLLIRLLLWGSAGRETGLIM